MMSHLNLKLNMSFIWNIALCSIALIVISRIIYWLYRWSNPKCTGKLPPGTTGFPIIGETIEFFKPYQLYEISPFIKKRMLRFGPLFRTNLMGSNTVISTDPDVILEIFRQENKNFILCYPKSFVKALGNDTLFDKPGMIHKYVRQISLQLLGSDNLKRNMIKEMDIVTRDHLRSKASHGTFDVKDAVSSLIIAYLTPKMISDLKPEIKLKLMKNYKAFNLDWFQSFFSLSAWRALYTVLKARRESMEVIKEIFATRKASKKKHKDFLQTVLEDLEENKESILKEDSALSLIFLLSVVSQEITSTVTALIVKFVSENQRVMDELRREHEMILEKREDKESEIISWEEYRHEMSFTNMVINESLRLASTSPLMFRKAVKDVEIKGYTIPAGWIVAVAPSTVHCDPQIYTNPFEFNPWRWEGKEMQAGSKTLMVFGGGVRLCAGADFAKLQISIFLHHLVVNYDFECVADCEITRTPLLHFPKGLLINVSPKLTSSLLMS